MSTDSRDTTQENPFADAGSQEEIQALLSAGPNEELRAEYQERFAATESPSERSNLWAQIQLEQQKQAVVDDNGLPAPSFEREGFEDIANAETPEDLARIAEEGGWSADVTKGGLSEEDAARDRRRQAIARGEDPNEVGKQLPPEEIDSALAAATTPQEIERLMESQGLTGRMK